MRNLQYPSAEFEKLTRFSRETPPDIQKAVAFILSDVCRRGDSALVDATWKFDRVRLTSRTIRVSSSRLKKASVSVDFAKAAKNTWREVSDFARKSLPKTWVSVNGHGARVGEKWDPLRRVGIYVPGGSVPLVSTVFMTVAIARVAGVSEIAVCTPPPISEPILWALHFCGVTEVYQLGGSQAMAALAFGTQTIRGVDKIFGPGNAYLTEAKRQLFGTVGVDLLAGPSELMTLVDYSTPSPWVAGDLLAQAEHGSGRERVFCVSDSQKKLKEIAGEVLRQSEFYRENRGLSRVLADGIWMIQTRNRQQLVEVANRLAPEHLQIMTQRPWDLAEKMTTAGGIFIGSTTPTVLGDFVAGPSHTLPTNGAGRSFSGLRTLDFMRRTSLVEYSTVALKKAIQGVKQFAEAEQLPAHGLSAVLRLSK